MEKETKTSSNRKRRIVLHLCVALCFMSLLIILMMGGLLFIAKDINQNTDFSASNIGSISTQNKTMLDDIRTIKSYVIPSDSILECFVGHNPKIRGTFVMVYKNNPFSLKEGEKIKIMNQNAEGTPSLTLRVRVNTFEKESNSRATMFVNTETFKTLGIEGKGLEQGVFTMQYKRIR